MTRDEAIRILKYNSNVIHKTINGETDPNEVEALNMAIKALEKARDKEIAIKEEFSEALCIALDFNEWLENMSEKYGWDKNDVQLLIKQLLMY